MIVGGGRGRALYVGNQAQQPGVPQAARMVNRGLRNDLGAAVGQSGPLAQNLAGGSGRGFASRSLSSLIQVSSRGGLRPTPGRIPSQTSQFAEGGTAAAASGSQAKTATAAIQASTKTLVLPGSPAGPIGRALPGIGRASAIAAPGVMGSFGGGARPMDLTAGGTQMSVLPFPGAAVSRLDGQVAAPDAPLSAEDAALQKDHQKLWDDLQAIYDKSDVTPRLEAAVRKDFEKIQAAATSEPDQAKVQALSDLVAGLNGQLPTDEQRQQIKDAFTAMLKSQGIADQALIDKTIADIQAVNRAANITSEDVALIVADRKAIDDRLAAMAPSDSGVASSPLLDPLPFPGGPFGALGGI